MQTPTPGVLDFDDFLARYEAGAGKTLDRQQHAAIRHGEGPLYIMAGPGSGKSEVMVARALKLVLVDGVEPESIILTTFTVKAARNLQDPKGMSAFFCRRHVTPLIARSGV